jgi:transposase-like protein
VYLDGIGVKVRVGGRVVGVPVLVAIGVREDGEKVLLSLSVMGQESYGGWKGVLEDLTGRGLKAPVLAIIDGSKGLREAVEEVWHGIDVQRCTVHKERNLLSHAPKHCSEEIKEDYRAIVYAESLEEAHRARERFKRKWEKRCEGVVRSLMEGGEELLTFYKYPVGQWKSLRSTNIIERVQGEFRRRIKTQSSLPTEGAVLIILYGLYASGQIRMRKIGGWERMGEVVGERLDMDMVA